MWIHYFCNIFFFLNFLILRARRLERKRGKKSHNNKQIRPTGPPPITCAAPGSYDGALTPQPWFYFSFHIHLFSVFSFFYQFCFLFPLSLNQHSHSLIHLPAILVFFPSCNISILCFLFVLFACLYLMVWLSNFYLLFLFFFLVFLFGLVLFCLLTSPQCLVNLFKSHF